MSLLEFFQVKHPTLPSSSTCAYSSLSRKDLDHTNKEVKRVLAVENSGESEWLAGQLIHALHHLFIASCACAHNLSSRQI